MNLNNIKATADVSKDSIAEHFISIMDDKFPSIKIAGVPYKRLIEVYIALGMKIRNNYGLWLMNNPLTKPYFEDNSKMECHPDEVSMDIVKIIWRKLNENWPFYDHASGGFLAEDRYYAFMDSGGFAGCFYGYATRLEAMDKLRAEGYVDTDLSNNTQDLGLMIAVLTGRQYIDRLYEICDSSESDESFDDYGSWFKPMSMFGLSKQAKK